MSTPGKNTQAKTGLRAGETQEATVRTPQATRAKSQLNTIEMEMRTFKVHSSMALSEVWTGWSTRHSLELKGYMQTAATWQYQPQFEIDQGHRITMIWEEETRVVMKVGDQIWADQRNYVPEDFYSTFCVCEREWITDWAIMRYALGGRSPTVGHRWDYRQALNRLVEGAYRIMGKPQPPNYFVRRELLWIQRGPQPDPDDHEEIKAFEQHVGDRLAAAQKHYAGFRQNRRKGLMRWRAKQAAREAAEVGEPPGTASTTPHSGELTSCRKVTSLTERHLRIDLRNERSLDSEQLEARAEGWTGKALDRGGRGKEAGSSGTDEYPVGYDRTPPTELFRRTFEEMQGRKATTSTEESSQEKPTHLEQLQDSRLTTEAGADYAHRALDSEMPGRKAATLAEEATGTDQSFAGEMLGRKAPTSTEEVMGTSQTIEGGALGGTAATSESILEGDAIERIQVTTDAMRGRKATTSDGETPKETQGHVAGGNQETSPPKRRRKASDSEVQEMDIDPKPPAAYRTTNRTWRPGSYIATHHQHLVQEVYDATRRYRMAEEVALVVEHPRHQYRIAQVNRGTGGMEEGELRNSTLGLTHGTDRQPSQEPHGKIRQLYTQCTRVPGEVMGPEDVELLRSHRPTTSMHFEGDIVGVPFVWPGGQQGFRYAKVCAKDEETMAYSTGLYQLDGGEHNPGMLRPSNAFYAMDRQSPTRKGLQADDIQEVPGRNGASAQEEWRNFPEPTSAGERELADRERSKEPEPQDLAGCDNDSEVARTLLNADATELHDRDAEDGVEVATSREEMPATGYRKHSQLFHEQSTCGPQDNAVRIFLDKEWQQETPCDTPLRLVCEDGTQLNGIFERSQEPGREGLGTLDINLTRTMHESAVAHLLQLLPLMQQENKMLHSCQYITFREIQLQSAGGVIFFRRVPHTASDEGGWIIEGIGVLPELRGKGIGTALVRQTIATVLQDCAQAGSPRTYISAEQHARWWLARLGFVRADPKWGLNRRKGTFAMVWRPTQRDLCAPYTTAEIQWGWQPRPIANPSNWCHVISVLQLLLATEEFTDRMRAATWPIYGVGDTIMEIMHLGRERQETWLRGRQPPLRRTTDYEAVEFADTQTSKDDQNRRSQGRGERCR